ncbi:hypothetical protein PLICRDRAFT_113559 [Plicaturopsis crispa FD-325 SS-3]|nr:hypothetical protein PLICRDRAFT_113559 [Plicaturopsis crispa FD-325 SS-3]
MAARSQLIRRFRLSETCSLLTRTEIRALATSSAPKKLPQATSSAPPPPPPKSWLTRQVQSSPTTRRIFMGIANLLGYGSPKQVAGRRGMILYRELCAVRATEEEDFWRNDCDLPPTFQSWFMITNLHVWLLTVRLRALPKPHGMHHIQALIDHFFLDVEDRIRHVLQPGVTGLPPPENSSFYAVVPTPSPEPAGPKTKRPKGRAPERLVTQQMKIFREQWAGLGISCDLGLVQGDAEFAGAMWRNFLGARGARGIAFDPAQAKFRRSVNLVGGEVESVAKVEKRGLDVEEAKDDGSGVHDYAPGDADKYIRYPETMATLVEYCRRELVRLEKISDEDILKEGRETSRLRFGPVKSNKSIF